MSKNPHIQYLCGFARRCNLFYHYKFKPDNQPKADADCKLGVHTASNQTNEKKYEFYWGYKNHVLVDCISGLPIYELTITANVYDSTVALVTFQKYRTRTYVGKE